jgi:hypothetical protein
MMEAVSAAGKIHQPTILLKGKNFMIRYLEHQIIPAMYGNTERGWTTDAEGLRWLDEFAIQTKP